MARRRAKWRTEYPRQPVLELSADLSAMVFRLPILLPSGNEYGRRFGRFLYQAVRNGAREMIMDAMISAAVQPPAECGRRRVTMVAFRPRLLDEGDNLPQGFKPIRDGLWHPDVRLLRDDSPKWARFGYGQLLVPREFAHVIIIIRSAV